LFRYVSKNALDSGLMVAKLFILDKHNHTFNLHLDFCTVGVLRFSVNIALAFCDNP
jgi:hypothetical protein